MGVLIIDQVTGNAFGPVLCEVDNTNNWITPDGNLGKERSIPTILEQSVQIILDREDVNNPLHPFMFDEICDQLGLDPEITGRLTMTVTTVEGEL